MDRAPRDRLNWGCGPVIAPGWLNADVIESDGVFPLDESPLLPEPWTERFDVIVANHSLQCLDYVGVRTALDELTRVLARGGYLRVLVPDVLAACKAFIHRDESWPGFVAISEPWSLDRKFAHYLTWGGQNRSCFTVDSLEDQMRDAGLMIVDVVPDEVKMLDSREGESVIVSGWKA